MWQGKTIDGYLEAVAEQIKWRRARPVVTQELRQHLEDQRMPLPRKGRKTRSSWRWRRWGTPWPLGPSWMDSTAPDPSGGC